ncbi:MAG: RND transporter, partial [Thermoleophilia bacterium]|nr:RND transporter [Thermoleophilia bacterium]
MSPRHLLLALVAALAITAAPASAPVAAHEGHDHADAPKPIAAAAVPTLEASSSEFELVAVPERNGLLITLDRFATNEPVAGAVIEVSVDGETVVATEAGGGTYRLASPRAVEPGSHDLTVTITAGDTADLLIGTLEI